MPVAFTCLLWSRSLLADIIGSSFVNKHHRPIAITKLILMKKYLFDEKSSNLNCLYHNFYRIKNVVLA